MIVKVTFHDNDYHEMLERLGKQWEQCFHLIWCAKSAHDIQKYIETESLWNEVMFNPNYTKEKLDALSIQDYGICLRILWDWIINWIDQQEDLTEDANYLRRSLHLELMMCFNDEAQNGEYLYYFTKDNISLMR